MEKFWLNPKDFYHISRTKKIILYGRSEDWIHKTLKLVPKKKIKYIVDNNESYLNSEYLGFKVYNPKILKKEKKEEIFIVITATPYLSVVEELKKKKYLPGINYCCTPVLYDWAKLNQLKSINKKIIFSCSDYGYKSKYKRKSILGGGIYQLDTNTREIKKKINGQIRQIDKVKNNYICIDHFKKELIYFKPNFEIINKFDLSYFKKKREKPNFCGLCFDESTNNIYITNAGSDEISIFNLKEQKVIEKFSFSKKKGSSLHHINDICFFKNKLYLSYFSFKGTWKSGVFDGGVCEIDTKTFKKKEIIKNLWMPHSIKVLDNSICVLNSMRGEFIKKGKVQGKFPGFARGISFDGNYYYIGQSEIMYMSRLFGKTKNIMCNAGIYIFDINTKASRFYNFPDLMNVHDIEVN